MRKIKAYSWRCFFTSAIISALVIAFAAALIFTETNTSGIGIREVSVPFSAELFDDSAAVTVNDRKYELSLSAFYDFFESRLLKAAVIIWLLL